MHQYLPGRWNDNKTVTVATKVFEARPYATAEGGRVIVTMSGTRYWEKASRQRAFRK